MDANRFDTLARAMTRAPSRRGVLTGVGALLVGLLGLATTPAAEAKRKKSKKKKKTCTTGTVKCGGACVNTNTNALHCGACDTRCRENLSCIDGVCQGSGCQGGRIPCGALCVDPTDDEAHCGGCGQSCNGDLTCLGGQCGCAAGTRCGNQCVDTQTDADHCGSCGNGCGDQECIGGVCNPSGCGANQIDCGGGRCIPGHANACCSQAECGPFNSSNRLVCQNDRCVCNTAGEGICQRYSDGSGTCDKCCPGGSGSCPGDTVCKYVQGPPSYGFCDCPNGFRTCQGFPSNRCSQDFATDHSRCGQDCVNCANSAAGASCCLGGRCVRGGGPGEYGAENFGPCGASCQPCPGGQICCNNGEGTPARCITDLNGGFCYRN